MNKYEYGIEWRVKGEPRWRLTPHRRETLEAAERFRNEFRPEFETRIVRRLVGEWETV